MHIFNQEILDIVKKHYPEAFSPECLTIGTPPKKELGSIAIGAFGLSKTLGIKPIDVLAPLSSELSQLDWVNTAVITGPYINISLSPKGIQRLLTNELSLFQSRNLFRENFGGGSYKDFIHYTSSADKQTLIVDYFSANIGKPLHIGHMCSPNIGQVILNGSMFLGWNTIGDNHLGDWGGLFGKLLVGYKKYGNEEAFDIDPVEHLYELYVRITAEAEKDESVEEEARQAFKKLSSGDAESMALWGKFTGGTVQAANEVVALIDVYPDVAVGESYYEGLPLPKIGNHPDLTWNMKQVVQELLELGIATSNEDGSVGVVFPEETKIPSCMLAKRDGTHGYLASDLACVKYRLTNGWNPDRICYCTDVRQELHFKQVFEISRQWIQKAAWAKNVQKIPEFSHIKNGYIRLKDGAMSSRKGNIIRLKDLLNEAFVRTEKILQEKNVQLDESDIRAIAVGAVKYSYLMQDRERDIVFDWDKALSLEGHSGPYIQYSYVRAKNILEKARELFGVSEEALLMKSDYSIEKNNNFSISFEPTNNDRELLELLSNFSRVVESTTSQAKPHILANYTYELACGFSAFYTHSPKLLEETNADIRNFRLTLVALVRQILGHSFAILAIRMPKKM